MLDCRKACALKKKERDEQYVMENRISMIQQNFDDATTLQGTVFSVDEGLLDEVETMFEFLRKEIIALRKKNIQLKKELAEAESDKRETFNHASSLDHSLALSKMCGEQMAKTNATLLDDNNRRRKESNNLKNELKTQQQAHESQLQEIRAEFELALNHREIELNDLKQRVQSSVSFHNIEVQAARDEAERKQEEQYLQISQMREEIRSIQDSHQEYLTKLFAALETTQESRKSTAVPGSLDTRRDDEIVELREEVAKLRQSAATEGNGNGDATRKEAARSMKYIVKKNRGRRKSQVQHLQHLTSQLEEHLAAGNLAQMQQLVLSLRETILVEEKSNSKMDRETVNMIDNAVMYSQHGIADADAALLADNQKLRRKLEKKHYKK